MMWLAPNPLSFKPLCVPTARRIGLLGTLLFTGMKAKSPVLLGLVSETKNVDGSTEPSAKEKRLFFSVEELSMFKVPFKVPEGATLFAVDAEPVFKLKDGSLVCALDTSVPFPKDAFRNNGSKADDSDLAFWAKRYASS